MGVAEAAAAELLLTLDDLPPGPWLELPSDAGPGGGEPAGGAGEALLAACLGDGFSEDALVAAADSARFVRPAAAMAFSSVFLVDHAATAGEATREVASPSFAEAFANAVAHAPDGAGAGGPSMSGGSAPRGGGEVIDVQVWAVECEVDLVRAVHRATITGGDVLGLVPIHVELAVLAVADALVLVWLADTPDPFPSADRHHALSRVAARLARRR